MKKHLLTISLVCLFSISLLSCAGNKTANDETPVDGVIAIEEVVTCCKVDTTKTSCNDETACDTTKACKNEKSTCTKDTPCAKDKK